MSTTQSIAERLREVADMYCRGVQAFVDLRRIANEIEQRDAGVETRSARRMTFSELRENAIAIKRELKRIPGVPELVYRMLGEIVAIGADLAGERERQADLSQSIDADGWIQTVTVEADGTRTVRLPAENSEIEFEYNDEIWRGKFILGGAFFHGKIDDRTASVPMRYATRWRTLPAMPPNPEPELPEFVREVVNRTMWGDMTPGEAPRKLLPLFRFPHDPPQVGDERLVVETWPSTHAAASAENLKHLKRITTLESDRDELLRLLQRAVSPGTGRYISDGWLKDALAAIERHKGGA